MSIEIRTGDLNELVAVNLQIVEFKTPYGAEVFHARLRNRRWYGLVAAEDDQLLGFKLGYEEAPGRFYSWLGGVIPEARGRGIARSLLHHQEAWVQTNGFNSIRVKSRNRYRAMLILLLSENYNIIDIEPKALSEDTRVHFHKSF